MELVGSVIVGDARNMMRTCDLIALQTDVKTIKVVVIDAEGKEELCIPQLKRLVHKVDEVCYVVKTPIKQKQQSEELDATIFTKDQQFFYHQNPISFAWKISRKVNTIWTKTRRINTPLQRINNSAIVEEDRREEAYLKSKEHLNKIKIMFYARECDGEAKRLMEELRPHFNLKGLELGGRNLSMPSWATGYRLVKFLPNLIRLQLSNLDINNLTCLGNLPHLKTLTLEYLNELEYMIDYCVASATTCLYPSLEKLVLYYLPKLKGWRRSSRVMAEEVYYEQLLGEISDNMEPLRLPQLSKLWVKSCPELEGILLCYVMEDLNLQEFNPRLLQVITQEPGSEYHHYQPNIPLENKVLVKKCDGQSILVLP